MADQILTQQDFINGKVDFGSLGEATNEAKVVTPRYGDQYKSAPLAIKEIEDNGVAAVAALNAKADQVVAQGFYKGYTTEALLLAAKPAVAEMRARADDTRKIYRWNRTSAEGVTPITGTWVDTGLSDKDIAAADATTKANAAEANAKTYTDAQLVDVEKLKTSTKNLFNGSYFTRRRVSGAGAPLTSSDNDVISQFIPVEFGKTYTISGLNLSLINGLYTFINGFSNNTLDSSQFVKSLSRTALAGNLTFTVDDPAIKYILFPLSSSGFGTLTQALNLPVQVEQGDKATTYEPYKYLESSYKT